MNVSIGKKDIKASDLPVGTSSIIGTIEGEALDTNITNKNGLDITREVIENVLASEDYKDGIENGWFIGFLGHPEDPNCMDFKNAGVVMTDMSIDDNGKVYAKFNIVNTEVGQVIKTFTDAGVKFGISIRGAGDIIGTEVDPDTFIFRGFDVVTFPAYPESIPKFDIAAATDTKYRKICESVKKHARKITSATALKELRGMFSDRSDIAKIIDSCTDAITGKPAAPVTAGTVCDQERLDAVMSLYLKASAELESAKKQLAQSRRTATDAVVSGRRKMDAVRRIMASQLQSMQKSLDASDASYSEMRETVSTLKRENESLKNSNLIYSQRIESSRNAIREKDSIIASLQSKLRKTVTASTAMETRASNLDEENDTLRSDVENIRRSLHEYQDAYAAMYAAQLGIDPTGIKVDDTTKVSELCRMIESATNTANIAAVPEITDIIVDDSTGDISDIVSI